MQGITSEEEEEPSVQLEVSTCSGKEAAGAAVAAWLRSAGAERLRAGLRAGELRPRLLAAAQQRPEEERQRLREEELKTQEALGKAAKQHRISEEARQRELQLRAQMRRALGA